MQDQLQRENFAVETSPSSYLTAINTLILVFLFYAIYLASNSPEYWHPALHSLRNCNKSGDLSLHETSTIQTSGPASLVIPAIIPFCRKTIAASESSSPPGLGNWDNSCYQNSILQGLASLASVRVYLDRVVHGYRDCASTKKALRQLISRLIDARNAGRVLWTPPKLKNMSSWSQQDAHEYFSMIMAEVEKESTNEYVFAAASQGLGSLYDKDLYSDQAATPLLKRTRRQIYDLQTKATSLSPVEGLLAQRVACQKCGYSEGLSLIPFNCVTLALGKSHSCDLKSCLDEYTALEAINGVECLNCTLLRSEQELLRVHRPSETATVNCDQSDPSLLQKVPAKAIDERLRAIRQALAYKEFPKEVLSICRAQFDQRTTSTKSRQVVIARPPTALVIHINRSSFDEATGAVYKNYASVEFPLFLDLRPWTLGYNSKILQKSEMTESWALDPVQSMLIGSQLDGDYRKDSMFELRAAVIHYGQHEHGHYVCYRRTAFKTTVAGEKASADRRPWFRLSDNKVEQVPETEVLAQRGVFMLFYERIE